MRIDGVSQSDILKDDKQMKNISEAIQKLQDTETNLGEDHIHTEEAADRIHNKGNVELVELRQTSKKVQMWRLPQAYSCGDRGVPLWF